MNRWQDGDPQWKDKLMRWLQLRIVSHVLHFHKLWPNKQNKKRHGRLAWGEVGSSYILFAMIYISISETVKAKQIH